MAKDLHHQRHDGAAGKMAGVPGEGVGRETEVAADELRPRLARLIGRESTGICKLYEGEPGRKTYYGEIASTESGSSSGPGAGAPAGACAGAWAGLRARPQVVRNRRRDGTRSSMTVSSVVRRNGCANLGDARLDEILASDMRARQTPHGPHKRSVCICDRGGSKTSFLPFLKRAAFFSMTRRIQTACNDQIYPQGSSAMNISPIELWRLGSASRFPRGMVGARETVGRVSDGIWG
ncbi:MAG: hypothetical protein L6R42_001412 [Xanthoria sp. 1 TBL-2021]|nr:MAG: hypothetical protein L6R42_001412 [Xanthoria sp. 1 TBL-2021]